jgi:plasmid maintenance system killer protein
MIVSFGDDETAKVWSGERSRRFPSDIQAVACASCVSSTPQEELTICASRPATGWNG